MDEKKIVHNYAMALYEISTNPILISQLRIISDIFSRYTSISALLGKSTIDDDERINWIKQNLADFLPEIRDFTKLLDSKGRINLIAKIAKEYEGLVYQKNNVERIFITTATPVKEATLIKVLKQFEKKVGHALIMEHSVDPSIIGGIKVKIGSTLYDDSIDRKLKKLANEIKKEV